MNFPCGTVIAVCHEGVEFVESNIFRTPSLLKLDQIAYGDLWGITINRISGTAYIIIITNYLGCLVNTITVEGDVRIVEEVDDCLTSKTAKEVFFISNDGASKRFVFIKILVINTRQTLYFIVIDTCQS